ncbi:hypothetical protein [Streptomyces griseocarneus]|uniref:hypothetical protein n=1 Tax=Streptomyces griseocarneus TaxID=51201 RepID=UPI00167E31B7|nr:hypothetical protein [Streptomyces griseocarneus]MBZ6475307.1 hypothetical protein [Streptomyces griseocarneus]
MPPANESPCAMMKRLAKELEKEIRRTEERTGELEDKIASLQAQPDPPEKEIQALKQTLESLRSKVAEDNNSLATLQDVITENC